MNMLSTLPLECFVCREVMFNYWFPNEPFNMNLHMIFTTALVVTAMTMALITCDLGIVFELVGATSACALAYILPPLCYVKLSKRSRKTYVAYGCIVFGFVVMVISLTQVCSQRIDADCSIPDYHLGSIQDGEWEGCSKDLLKNGRTIHRVHFECTFTPEC